ncbi:hypothetical protein LTR50_002671 [Elasticomyces elasticus]|nr:hypothetical protein LTR50_002671 [Elasticomyces elasticus]
MDEHSASVTREGGTKRKRNSQEHQAEDVPWTAARCNRLLRPILSRIPLLQKKVQAKDAREALAPVKPPTSLHTSQNEDTTPWNIASGAKELKTYASSRPTLRTFPAQGRVSVAAQTGPALSNGEILLPTPFVHRTRGRTSGTDVRGQTQLTGMPLPVKRLYSKGIKQEQTSSLPTSSTASCDTHRLGLEKGIQAGFSHLLKKTGEDVVYRNTGAPSLLSLCLRRLPEHIELENHWRRLDHPDEEPDSRTEIYEELERLSGHMGWKHLREAVRADGLYSISKNNMLFGNRYAHYLGSALYVQDTIAVERLVTARIASLKQHDLLTDLEAGDKIDLFFDSLTRHPEVRLRILEQAMRSGPINRLADGDMLRRWSLVVRLVANGSAEAVKFLHETVPYVLKLHGPTDLGGSRDKSQRAELVMSHLATTLLTMALVAQGCETDGNTTLQVGSVIWLIHSIATECLRLTVATTDAGTTAFVLGSLLLQCTGCSLAANLIAPRITKLVEYLKTAKDNDVPILICGIANCCGKAYGDSGVSALQHIVQQLCKPNPSKEVNACLRNMALESTLHFSQTVRTVETLTFAQNLKKALHDSDDFIDLSKTPGAKSPGIVRHRWEEGLCEWIVATPGIAMSETRPSAGVEKMPPLYSPAFLLTPQPSDDAPESPSVDEDDEIEESAGAFSETPSRSFTPLTELIPRARQVRKTPLRSSTLDVGIGESPDVLGLTPGVMLSRSSSFRQATVRDGLRRTTSTMKSPEETQESEDELGFEEQEDSKRTRLTRGSPEESDDELGM